MNSKGFTMLEVLVALTITAMIAVSVFLAFSGYSKAERRTEQTLERTRMVNFALDKIREVVSESYLSWVPGREGMFVFEGKDQEHINEPFDSLTFTSLAHKTFRAQAKESELIEMTLFTSVDERGLGPEGTRLLRLREGGEIDEDFDVTGGIVYTLCWSVSRFQLAYLDSDGSLKEEWRLADRGNQFPCAVVVWIGIMPEEGTEEDISCILIPIYLSGREDCVFERGSLDGICSGK